MLEIADLTHSYADGHTAIDGLNLTVEDGSLVCLVGPSGCGKSTLLRCIAGLIHPSGGTVTLNGEPVHGVPDDLAVVFQDYSRSLFPWMTVRDNVALPLKRKGLSRSERREAADTALAEVGLEGAGRKYHWQLSGGMQQRVAIARALAYKPSLLLMDEPFGAVDAQTREDLEDLVLALHRSQKMTIVLVTHDIDESVYLGDRVVVLGKSPARVRADLPVLLPAERDQIETRSAPEFIRLRAEVGRFVRGAATDTSDAGKPVEGDAEAEADEVKAEAKNAKADAKAKSAKTKAEAKAETEETKADAKAEAEAEETKADAKADAEETKTEVKAEGTQARRRGRAKAKAEKAKAEKAEAEKAETDSEAEKADETTADKAETKDEAEVKDADAEKVDAEAETDTDAKTDEADKDSEETSENAGELAKEDSKEDAEKAEKAEKSTAEPVKKTASTARGARRKSTPAQTATRPRRRSAK